MPPRKKPKHNKKSGKDKKAASKQTKLKQLIATVEVQLMYQESSEKDPSNTAYRQLAQQHQKEMDRHFQEWHGKAIGLEEPSTAPDTITDEQRFAIRRLFSVLARKPQPGNPAALVAPSNLQALYSALKP